MKQFIPRFVVFSKIFDLVLEEKLKGGKADGLSLADIAMRHNVKLIFIEEQYQIGVLVEKEHSTDSETVDEIVKDHLFEDPNYYTKLKKIEK